MPLYIAYEIDAIFALFKMAEKEIICSELYSFGLQMTESHKGSTQAIVLNEIMIAPL